MNKDEISGILEACKFLVVGLTPLGLKSYAWDQVHQSILFAASEAIQKSDITDVYLLDTANISTSDLLVLKRGLQFYLEHPKPLL